MDEDDTFNALRRRSLSSIVSEWTNKWPYNKGIRLRGVILSYGYSEEEYNEYIEYLSEIAQDKL